MTTDHENRARDRKAFLMHQAIRAMVLVIAPKMHPQDLAQRVAKFGDAEWRAVELLAGTRESGELTRNQVCATFQDEADDATNAELAAVNRERTA